MEPKIIQINISDILPNRFQPRIAFNEDKLNELSESIKKYGVIQPITVRQVGNKYEIIAGERRYKASQLAGLSTIPAIVQNFSDEISSEVALIENVQREDLTAIEEAISYKKILDMGTITQEKLADKLGVSQPAIANKLRLLQLSEKVQDALMENKISERHARSLLKLKNKVKQEEMLHRIINERLTVRKTDEEIKKLLNNNEEEKVKSFIPTPEEIEILDIINSFKMEEKKEEEKMIPNDPMNNFNIPSVSIENGNDNINTISPVNNVVNSQENNVQNNSLDNNIVTPVVDNFGNSNVINPGFMDIDKIEREATDISLNNSNKVDLIQGNNVTNTNEMPKGKFFDVMPSMQNRMETDDSSENNGGRIVGGSIFNDDSQILGASISDDKQDNVTTQEFTNNNIDFNSNVFNNPIIEPVDVKEVYPSNIESTPATNNLQDNQFSFLNENNNYTNTLVNNDNEIIENIQNNIVEDKVMEPSIPVVNPTINVNNMENSPVIEKAPNTISSSSVIENNGGNEEVNSTKIVEEASITPEIKVETVQNVVPNTPVIEDNTIKEEINSIPTVEVSSTIPEIKIESIPSMVPESPILENNMGVEEINPIPNIEPKTIMTETKVEPMVVPSSIPTIPIIEENSYEIKEEPVLEPINTVPLPKEKEPEINISAPLSFNMREAIQMIRNITDRLERMGHRLDSDEMDLNDRYEIKITLYK